MAPNPRRCPHRVLGEKDEGLPRSRQHFNVTAETSGHAEAVKVVYKTDQVDYAHLLDTFWHNIDPTDDGGQFCDRGDSYRSEIFYVNDAQKTAAESPEKFRQRDSASLSFESVDRRPF